MNVTYKDKNSASCDQVVAIYNWTTGYWIQLDKRSVGTTEVEIAAAPGGTLADYVSGSSGDGDVAVRVRCTRGASVNFYASGDLMRIAYEK